jgi:hypothetical protein
MHGASVVVCCVAESEAYPRQRWFSDGRQGYGMANFAVASRKAEDTDPAVRRGTVKGHVHQRGPHGIGLGQGPPVKVRRHVHP